MLLLCILAIVMLAALDKDSTKKKIAEADKNPYGCKSTTWRKAHPEEAAEMDKYGSQRER